MVVDWYFNLRSANDRTSYLIFPLLFILMVSGLSAELIINQRILEKIDRQYGNTAMYRAIAWKNLLLSASQVNNDSKKLILINDFFNKKIEFVSDFEHWQKKDYWATPLEFVASGAGDCEDFAIAKYFSLLAAGVAEDKLRITYVKALKQNQAHMVLTYFATPQAIPLVLDNLIPQIKKATKRKDLLPVYSFNGSGLWLAKLKGSGQRVGNSKRLGLWQNLKMKIDNGK
jgi:predicted transglutaminase-like cysteine proteinase